MTSKEIKKRLNNLLNKDRSKRFMEHIIRSYIPPHQVKRVYEDPGNDFSCAITNEALTALNEVKSNYGDEKGFLKDKDTMFVDEGGWEHPFKQKVGDKEVGITSERTETYLSYRTFLILYEWVIKEYFKGNKSVRRVLRDDEDLLVAKAKDFEDEDKSIQQEITRIESEKKGTTTFGDIDKLKELKNKMSKND